MPIVWTEIPASRIPLKVRETKEMPVNAVVTAKSGPNIQATALAINGAGGILFLPDRKVVQIFTGGDTNSPPEKEFDLTGVTTVTVAISGNTYTFTIS